MRIRRVMPVVHTKDPEACRRFYVDLLGFGVAMDQDGLLMLASTSVPTTQLIVAWPSPSAMDPAVLEVDVSVEVEDVDAAHAAVQAAGLEVIRAIRDEPWGVRRFFVRDPAGRVLNVASHLPAA